jgi:hypothetical protein
MMTERMCKPRTLVPALFLVIAQLVGAGGAAAQQYRVPKSVPSKCRKDAATRIQSWIDSAPDGATLRFERGACYRVERTLEFHNRWLTFDGNGARFKSFNPPKAQGAMWRAWDSTVTFTSMTLVGSYAHGGVHDRDLQWAHGIDLRGADAAISDVAMSDLAGDCVYFGLGSDGSSGLVSDSRCRRIGRNAVSVTAGNDIRVTRMRTRRIGHIVFDVEPNVESGVGASRVTFDSNVIVRPYWLMAYTVIANEPVIDQAFTNNRIIGESLRIGVVDRAFRPQNVTVAGNSSDTPGPAPLMNFTGVDGLTVSGNDVPVKGGGTLAQIQGSCGVSVFGNSYPGGEIEAGINEPAC